MRPSVVWHDGNLRIDSSVDQWGFPGGASRSAAALEVPGHRSTPPTEAVWRQSADLVNAATLAALLIDSAVANGAGRKVAAAFQDAPDTPQGPRVIIHGFPVLA